MFDVTSFPAILSGIRCHFKFFRYFNCNVCNVAELGDFNPDEHREGYLSELRFVPNQTDDFESEVTKHHQSHRYGLKQLTSRIY